MIRVCVCLRTIFSRRLFWQNPVYWVRMSEVMMYVICQNVCVCVCERVCVSVCVGVSVASQHASIPYCGDLQTSW